MWKEELPENCPPLAAIETEAKVIRFIQNNVPSMDDFVTYFKKKPNNIRYSNLCLSNALSFYDNIANAKIAYKEAKLRNKDLGSYMGVFSLKKKDGRCEYKKKKGHYSLWQYSTWKLEEFELLNVVKIDE